MLAFIAGQAARTVVSYVIRPYRPRSKSAWPRLGNWRRSAGGWSLAGGHLPGLTGDNLFVGRTMGPAALGLYALAFRITELPRRC
jgi:O-antigen/teichoic acid export membrane protein